MLGAFNLRTWAGTTSRMLTAPLVPIENWKGYNSLHPFAAGATSGGSSFAGGFIFEKHNEALKNTATPFDPQKDPNPSACAVKAYKSYFMFDDLFLAMGCGIENKMLEIEGNIVTTIDQTERKLDFQSGETIINNGFYYRVLKEYTKGNVVLETGNRKTRWQALCIENKLPETEEAIFHLYIDHGRKVKSGSYAYTVSCHKEALSQVPVVLSNTMDVQAAESFDGCKLGAVFYKANIEIKSSKGFLKSSAPCALLLERTKSRLLLTVTDGLMDQSLKEIIIETSIAVEGQHVSRVPNGNYRITVPLQGGQLTGAPVSIHLSIKNE